MAQANYPVAVVLDSGFAFAPKMGTTRHLVGVAPVAFQTDLCLPTAVDFADPKPLLIDSSGAIDWVE